MSALDKLRNARYSRVRSELYSERLARLRSAAQGLTSQLNSAAGKGTPKAHDRLAELLATIVDLEVDLSYAIVDSEKLTSEAEAYLDKLPPVQQMVVRLRHMRGYDWAKVAEEMDYSERQCQRHLEEAERNLSKY